ncbi:hypothetical protein FRC00_002813 [Tulasnella sp. 408]|nr:hypothetical protein FRC00_002813 [Tulasnella sp. 408]
MFRGIFNANLNLWPKKSRSIGVVLLRYCIKVQERLESDRNLTDGEKQDMKEWADFSYIVGTLTEMDIHRAIEQALNALEQLNNGHKYNEHKPSDPLKLAEDRIKLFVPRTEWTQPIEDDDKNKVATATNLIRYRDIRLM